MLLVNYILGLYSGLNSGLRKAEFYRANVTEWHSLLSFFEQVKQKYHRIDFVFANAGVGEKNTVFTDIVQPDGSLAPPDLKVIDINLKGVIYSMLFHHPRIQVSLTFW